jgi:hypothetical protein
VLELTPLILQKLYSAIEPGPHDFVRIVDAQGRVHYLNKRTGTTTVEPPAGFEVEAPSSEIDKGQGQAQEQVQAAEAAGAVEAAASVAACGKGEEEVGGFVMPTQPVKIKIGVL